MLDGDDRVEKPEGICAEAVSPEHPVVNGFSDYPVFLGYNQAVATVGQHASIHRQKIKNNGVTKVTPFIKYKD